jgi:RNA polymerase sigma-70 factor (ECF subfamily)
MTGPSITREALAGEREFRILFDAHFADVWRFARRRCASSSDADDATAEVFAVAWQRRDDLPVDQARLWLFGVAHRILANQRRSSGRQARLCVRLTQEAERRLSEPLAQESDGSLWKALAALSADDRELLIMRAWDELPVRNMATLLGCSPNAVSLRLYKARRRLARSLREKEAAEAGHVVADPGATEEGCREQV